MKNSYWSLVLVGMAVGVLTICFSGAADETLVSLIGFVPTKSPDYFTQGTPFLSIDDRGNIFALSNRENLVFKFARSGDLLLKYGSDENAPYRLAYPYCISCSDQKVLVTDHNRVFVFDSDGSILGSFRKFRPTISVGGINGLVVLMEAGDDKLISLYDYSGEKKNTFHKRYAVNYDRYKGWDQVNVDNIVNRGKVFCLKNRILYLSFLFGDLFIYDLAGTKVSERKIGDASLYDKNTKTYLSDGIENRNNVFPVYSAFTDSYLLNDKLYILMNDQYYQNAIWQCNINTGVVENRFRFTINSPGKNAPLMIGRSILVELKNGAPVFIISFYNKSTDKGNIGLFEVGQNTVRR